MEDIFTLTSPRYPKVYPLLQDCLWILTSPSDGTIHIEFIDFNTGLSYDKLDLALMNIIIDFDIDGGQYGVYQFTGKETPKSLAIAFQQIQLAWDPSVWSLDSFTGFHLQVTWKNSTGNVISGIFYQYINCCNTIRAINAEMYFIESSDHQKHWL